MAVLGLLLWPALAQGENPPPDAPKPHVEPRTLPPYFPSKPSIAASWSIPIENLGFAPPGPLYLGSRSSLASLDFLDENRLLFTFRVPALLHRPRGGQGDDEEHEIRAVVLAIPSGAVEAEANWLLHDRGHYLWMLHDGHFLLRDRDGLSEGDASLKLTPVLKFPGPLLTVELDPSQQLMVTNSREPVKKTAESGSPNLPSLYTGDSGDSSQPKDSDLVLRILERESGQVVLVTRMGDLVHLPINNDGYLESQRGTGVDWTVSLNFFGGGSRSLGAVKSVCMPDLNFVSEREFLADACADMGNNALLAMTTSGDTLWIDLVPDRQVWPLFTVASNGRRIARESLYVSHSINAYSPLGDDDIKGQWLQVLDAATGQLAFEAPVDPILDAGGNVALSPSGRRVAVINHGAIQIFELPAAPELRDPDHPSN